MNYFLLSQWVKENNKTGLTVEKTLLAPPTLEICFKNSENLLLYYKSSNPFPFFTNEFLPAGNESYAIWNQLQKAEFADLNIAETDRIITLVFRLKDIYQRSLQYHLVFECMPPQGNIILCQEENNKLIILDALSKYTYADNPQRQILPGLPYEPPRTSFRPAPDKTDFPITVRDSETGEKKQCNNTNDYFETYYKLVVQKRKEAQQKSRLLAYWQKELKKVEKKLARQKVELEEAELVDTWLNRSELIKVSLDKIKKGDTALSVINYYDPDLKEISIPLLADKNPQENLKHYLKKYRKAKQGRDKIAMQIEKTNREISQIKQILLSFNSDQWRDLDSGTGQTGTAAARLKQTDSLLKIKVDENWEIIIGRKAKENDLITTQIGNVNDWWFHTRIYHGSHILLRNFRKKEPSTELIEICCGLAAWFSKARHSQNVPVDFTQIRYVRKPRKSAPGYVTYTNQKTVFTDPIDVNNARERLFNHAG